MKTSTRPSGGEPSGVAPLLVPFLSLARVASSRHRFDQTGELLRKDGFAGVSELVDRPPPMLHDHLALLFGPPIARDLLHAGTNNEVVPGLVELHAIPM
jgi:hypothetical protein